ncbi:MAG TPA: response regulator transcription factor [Terracidiphilus sp.]|nr:response regulator transcription factor [Terracidiphilus sp.]
MNIRILIVDDHSLFRESLGRMLQAEPGLSVVGECSSLGEALAALSTIEADVILLDYDLGNELGTLLLAELKKRQVHTSVLIVTAGMPSDEAFRGLDEGVKGILLKHSSLDQLINAIRTVAAGERWLGDEAVRALLSSRYGVPTGSETARPLTARQSEVMRGILDGLTNKEIAFNLKSSETSVKAVIQELFQKAGVRTRSQLVRIAIEKHSSDWLGQRRSSDAPWVQNSRLVL